MHLPVLYVLGRSIESMLKVVTLVLYPAATASGTFRSRVRR